ncbi:MAG: hypothetical protein RL077_1554 [Verrucomicrobiota bacterium]|jgi:hypothetical protein
MPAYQGADGKYAAGDAFPVASAELRISDIHRPHAVTAEDKAVTFNLMLSHGSVKLQTWFRDAAGQEIAGVYYVTVRALRPGS